MPHTVSAAAANRQFSEILGLAARGEAVTITRRGAPVAQLVPYSVEGDTIGNDAAWNRLLTVLEKGVGNGIGRFDRDALYRDRCDGR